MLICVDTQDLKEARRGVSKWALQRGEVILDLDCLVLVRPISLSPLYPVG